MKAKVKATGKIVDGIPIYYGSEGKGYLDVPVDHDIFNRYDLEEVEFLEQPSLPEGLEEVAEKLSDSECAKIYGSFSTKYDKDGKCLITTLVSGDFETIKEFGIKLFKAGATWRDQQIPKLPNNLDETANEFANQDCVTFISRKKGFKAGAEWMAEQGETIEFVAQYEFGVSDTSTSTKRCTLTFPLPANIVEGDKVIVQIRRK